MRFLGFVYNIIFGLCLTVASNTNTTNTTTNATTTRPPIPVITLAPSQLALFQLLLPPAFFKTLPPNLVFWNITRVIEEINKKEPRALYDIVQRNTLLTLPQAFVRQLPQPVLAHHHLCQFVVNPNVTCTNYSGVPNCFPPWMFPTEYDNPISQSKALLKGCSLSCDHGERFFSFTPAEQKLIDRLTLSGCFITLVALIGIVVNQFMDWKGEDGVDHSKNCSERPLMWQIPFAVTGASVVILFFFFLPFIAGKKNIVCSKSYGHSTLSFWNPGIGKNGRCAVTGTFFYGSILYYFFYTLLLTFVIFRQFWNPANPLWGLPNYYFHCGITLIVLIFVSIALGTNSFDPVYPMGLCFPGVTRVTGLLLFVCLPFLFITIACVGFLAYSIMHIQQNIQYKRRVTTANAKESTRNMRDLRMRLVLYCVGEVFILLLLTVTAFVFYTVNDNLHSSFSTQFRCVIFSRSFETCPRSTRISAFWFITWTIAVLFAAISQLSLSCHDRWRSRVKKITIKMARTVSTLEASVVHGSKEKSRTGSTRHLFVKTPTETSLPPPMTHVPVSPPSQSHDGLD